MNKLEIGPSFASEKKESDSERTLAQVIQHILENSYIKAEEIPAASAKAALAWYERQVGFSRDNEQHFPQEDVDALRRLAQKEEVQAAQARQDEETQPAMTMPERPAQGEEPTQEIAMPSGPEQAKTPPVLDLSEDDLKQLGQIRSSIREALGASQYVVPESASAKAILKTYREYIAFDANNADLLSEADVANLETLVAKEEGVKE